MGSSPRKGVLLASERRGPLPPAVPDQTLESRLLARARRNDAVAFAALFKAHKHRVYTICLNLTRNTATAEDLTQEAFIQLFRKLSTFRGESAFRTWFHRMVVNVVLMNLRRKRLPMQSLEELEARQEENLSRHVLQVDDPRLTGTVDRLAIAQALARLAPGYRTILLLHDVEGYDHREIAEILHCSPGTTKSQLHKARRKLREILDPASRRRRRHAPGFSLPQARAA